MTMTSSLLPGSILGLLDFFITYINDIAQAIKTFVFIIYADDCPYLLLDILMFSLHCSTTKVLCILHRIWLRAHHIRNSHFGLLYGGGELHQCN